MRTEISPEIQDAFGDLLNDFEMYQFSILLKQWRKIQELKASCCNLENKNPTDWVNPWGRSGGLANKEE